MLMRLLTLVARSLRLKSIAPSEHVCIGMHVQACVLERGGAYWRTLGCAVVTWGQLRGACVKWAVMA